MVNKAIIQLEVPIIISYRDRICMPIVELRKKTSNPELMKKLITCAFHQTPLVILPKFTDKLNSINNLIEKGIIYYNPEQEQYFFNI